MVEKKNSFRVAVVGALAIDHQQRGEGENRLPGGTVYYASLALAEIGVPVLAVPLLARRDQALLDCLKHRRIEVLPQFGQETTVFLHRYTPGAPDRRDSSLLACGARFQDLPSRALQGEALLLGPLCQGEMSLSFYQMVRREYRGLVATDLQGLLRRSQAGPLYLQSPDDLPFYLYQADIIKGDEQEICLASKVASPAIAGHYLRGGRGRREIIVTAGERGATIYTADGLFQIPARKVAKKINSTGCGDTFLAAYLAGRINKMNANRAGLLAGRLAAEKLSVEGPYRQAKRRILPSFLRKKS